MADDRTTAVDELHALRAAACDWRLSRGDVAVYAVLLQHFNFRSLESRPGPTRIATIANLAISNVKSSLLRLEQLRYISVIRPGPRIANRYEILESPQIPSRKTARAIAEGRRSLGMPASPELGMHAGLVSNLPTRATRPAGRSATRPAHRPQLGLPAGHELAFELSSELSSASPASNSQKSEQPEPDDWDAAA